MTSSPNPEFSLKNTDPDSDCFGIDSKLDTQ